MGYEKTKKQGELLMKALVTYFSQTGNTEKIAKAICDAASESNEAELKNMTELDPGALSAVDVVFVGSPIHAANIAKEVGEFLGGIPESSNLKLAGFITHAGAVYPPQDLEAMAQPFSNACQEKGIDYKGCFNCQGYLGDFMHEAVQKMQNLTDDEWAENVKQMTGHPDADDEANAKAFAKSVLS
jgi:flavodoxin I